MRDTSIAHAVASACDGGSLVPAYEPCEGQVFTQGTNVAPAGSTYTDAPSRNYSNSAATVIGLAGSGTTYLGQDTSGSTVATANAFRGVERPLETQLFFTAVASFTTNGASAAANALRSAGGMISLAQDVVASNGASSPVVDVSGGGAVDLGTGSTLTMFKGLGERKTMVEQASSFGVSALAVFLAVRLLATVIAATSGFRGGRIFPLVAADATFGLLVHALFSAIPLALSLACAIMGFTLVATRDGWLSLFLAAAMVPGPHRLPLLCLMVLPAWRAMAGRAEMIVKTPALRQGEAPGAAAPAAKASV